VSVTDVLYFTMITVTTVGYCGIVPVSDAARLIDAFFVTPVRIFVWFIFLGTAYQFIIQRLIEEWHMTRLQRNLQDRVVLCGYGDSGSVARRGARALGDGERLAAALRRLPDGGRGAEPRHGGVHLGPAVVPG
jgi:voltage-gated potassium channel